jgi:hypothetical protein
MNPRKSIVTIVLIACTLALPAVQAASVYLTPALQTVPSTDGTATLELFMDFTGDPTVGGGIDLALSGPISIVSFTPSAYFDTDTDPFFSGFGTAEADADFEVHFGNFAGLDGLNKLGDLTISLLGGGISSIAMNINSTFGEFFDIDSAPQVVALSGANINISAVPVPAAIWFFASGLGLLGGFRRLTHKLS